MILKHTSLGLGILLMVAAPLPGCENRSAKPQAGRSQPSNDTMRSIQRGFERSMRGFQQQSVKQEAEQFESLASVDLGELRRSWHVNLDAKDRPARELLSELLTAMGLSLHVADELAADVEQRVTISLQNVSPLQAVEGLCRQIGVYPQYLTSKRQKNAVTLHRRPRP